MQMEPGEKWTAEWNIGINCKCLIMCPEISVLGSDYENTYKFLGVILDRRLNFQRPTTMLIQTFESCEDVLDSFAEKKIILV